MPKIILGLTGEKLGGKDTAAQYLVENYKAFHARHSHILDDILKILGQPISRRNEIDLGMGLRQIFGVGVLGTALKKRIAGTDAEIIVINGIRFQDELENARSLGAKIIYITAPENIRFERFLARNEKTDDGGHTLEEFRIQEQEPTEIGIPALGAQADYKIENAGTLESFFSRIDKIVNELKFL